MCEFSDEKRLLLQQLRSLQAISDKSTDAREVLSSESGPPPPEKWRLLQEGSPLYDWQRECLATWRERGYRGTVKVATGGGKTRFALAAAQELQNDREHDLRLVIVVPTIVLMNQWREELDASNLPPSCIGLLGGGNDLSQDRDYRIIISVIDSARELLPQFATKMVWKEKMLLVVDECHRANTAKNRRIFETNPKYALGLSATPEAYSEDDGKSADERYAQSPVGKCLGPIIYEFSLKDSLDAGLLTSFDIYHVGLKLGPNENSSYQSISKEIAELKKKLEREWRRSKSKQDLIAWCQSVASRNKPLAESASRFIGLSNERKRLLFRASSRFEFVLLLLSAAMRGSARRAIVFHEEIKAVNRLFCSAIEKHIPAVLEHSELPKKVREENIELFRKGAARAIISAKSLIEGFNVPSADVGIIAASTASVRQRIQSLGRMLRKKAGTEKAIIVVLYIEETRDEEIYGKADWELIVGAESNHYCELPENGLADHECLSIEDVLSRLNKREHPPRQYRPPCSELRDEDLVLGEEYPGHARGIELQVDQMENLRSNDGGVIPNSHGIVARILETNKYRRALMNSCGHLVCRDDRGEWIFIGRAGQPVPMLDNVERFVLKQARGKRRIARKVRGDWLYAQGPDATLIAVLSCLEEMSKRLSIFVDHVYQTNDGEFFVEVRGERIWCNGASGKLEFPND